MLEQETEKRKMSGDLSRVKLRLPPLTREILKKGKFGKWRKTAWSIANAGGYQEALEEGADADLPTKQIAFSDMPYSDEDEIKAAKKVQRNSVAMAMLNLAVVGAESAARSVARGCDDDWPGGRASIAWKYLTDKFTDEGLMDIAELRRKLEKIKINSEGDAEKLFDEVYRIETAAK